MAAAAAAPLQFLCCLVCLFTSLATGVVYRAASAVTLRLLRLSKIHGEACSDALELARHLLGSAAQSVFDFLKDVTVAIISGLFEALTEAVVGSVRLTASAVAEGLAMSRAALDGVAELVSVVVAGAAEMMVNVVWSVLSSAGAAVGYIMDGA